MSQWLPSGAAVEALRNVIYFGEYQHVHPVAVSGCWAGALFVLMMGHRDCYAVAGLGCDRETLALA
jgi:hypothetical protein